MMKSRYDVLRSAIQGFGLICVLCVSQIVADSAATSSYASMGWGFEVGRANETDVESLLTDQLMLASAFERMLSIANDILGPERQRQLLGDVDGGRSAQTNEQLRAATIAWWRDKVHGPAQRIVRNPAASCAEAQIAANTVFVESRQKQLLGIEVAVADINAQMLSDFRTRCEEEALDECNSTGRWEQVVNTFFAIQRQAALIGHEMADQNSVINTLEECAIYEVHYVSTTKVDSDFLLESVIDGKIKLTPRVDRAKGIQAMTDVTFEGEVGTGTNPFLQKLTCSLPEAVMVCSPGGNPAKTAWAKIEKMGIKSKEFVVNGGRVQTRAVGADHLTLSFSPAMISGIAKVNMKDSPEIPVPFLEVGASGFSIAHKRSEYGELRYMFSETKKNGYPVLFEFTRTGNDITEGVKATDSTVFRLIHRPKKKPFPPRPSTPRVPLRPKT